MPESTHEPQREPAPQQNGWARQLHGCTFLSLEHWAYMFLVVLLPILLVQGFYSALTLWVVGQPASTLNGAFDGRTGPPQQALVFMAILSAAGILVALLVFLLLYSRTQAELRKRPDYVRRLAYRLPVYGALAALSLLKLAAVVVLVALFLYSLVLIGTDGNQIGSLYLGQFLPVLLAAAIFAGAEWYAFRRAKGRDDDRIFAMAITVFACVLIIALFVTSLTISHNTKTNLIPQLPSKPRTLDNLNNGFGY